MDLITYSDVATMMAKLGQQIADELMGALANQPTASLAVPGGTTPGPVFDVLCEATSVDWARVHVMLTDERWVPETSERSNTRLLKQRLLVKAAADASYVPFYGGTDTPEESLANLQDGIEAQLPLSVCLLGMGADMHTASIFPGADKLTEALHGDAVLVPMRAPGAPEPRMTLSAAALNGAKRRHILITGNEKRAALERAQDLSPAEAPVAAILAGSTIHWAES